MTKEPSLRTTLDMVVLQGAIAAQPESALKRHEPGGADLRAAVATRQ